jgi:uncharacterized protein YjbI with pentapeptide repeats
MLLSPATSSTSRADIFRWDNGQVIPGTEGIVPGPGIDLANRQLQYAGLSSIDLTGADFLLCNLANANLAGADLTNASLSNATLTSANLTGAMVSKANFRATIGLTKEQLYSTASYQQKNLQGIAFGGEFGGASPPDLSGWDLSGQNLMTASFSLSTLTDANLAGANLTNADLGFSTLTDTNLSGANLTYATFIASTLTGANLTDAIVNGTTFGGTSSRGFTKEQLYSTASYRQKSLRGIRFRVMDLSGWDLSGQDLTNADLGISTLAGANLAGAIVSGANFEQVTGFTKEQLYTTANYQQKNLKRISFDDNNLTAWNLSGQDLTSATLRRSTLTSANLAEATVTGADFSSTTSRGFTKEQLYSTANYQQKKLQGIGLAANDLTGWDLSGQDLMKASFGYSKLSGANLTGATVTGADFGATTTHGFTKEQLYSTASYQQKILQGIGLGHFNDLTSWNLSGQNLTNANFLWSFLTNADLAGANLTNASLDVANLTNSNLAGAVVAGAIFSGTTSNGFTKEQLYSTSSYQHKNLEGIVFGQSNAAYLGGYINDLAGWDLSGQNLTNANFETTILTDTILADAIITGANFSDTTFNGFTKEQLYSTASYQQRNLQGIHLSFNNLTSWDLNGQDLSNADFSGSTLTAASLAGANLTNAHLGATLTDANLTTADLRGSKNVDLTGAISRNAIHPNGIVQGLDLAGGDTLMIRDDDGVADPPPDSWWLQSRPSIPITVHDQSVLINGGVLRLVFESDAWDSLISFEPGIPVTLGGTLELGFASGVDVQSQAGRTIRLFDWSGVTPTGIFNVESAHLWDLSRLYSAGEVTLLSATTLPGDFNSDGTLDAADYVVWRNGLGTTYTQTDYNTWRANFGKTAARAPAVADTFANASSANIPEPVTAAILSFALLPMCIASRKRWRQRPRPLTSPNRNFRGQLTLE